jgi:pimeloyl-ACP methyl ester carboxylesterase
MSRIKSLRKYGKPPFTVAVVHGGPGAAGEMAPVAHEFSSDRGVLEPLQTAISFKGQIEELSGALEERGAPPVTLIGFSWGAWLSFVCAAHYPHLVRKLILVGSGPFEEGYAQGIQAIRLSRLSKEEKLEVASLIETLNGPAVMDKAPAFKRFGELFSKADAYDPIEEAAHDFDIVDYRVDIFLKVWPEAAALRSSGKLVKLGKKIQCPVVAIHGDYDPHPAAGVEKPLSGVIKDFRLVLLNNCGHKPWIEREARGDFYRVLKKELEVYRWPDCFHH